MIDFDPTVELLDANSIGFNDDGPTSADSQLVATATTGGFTPWPSPHSIQTSVVCSMSR